MAQPPDFWGVGLIIGVSNVIAFLIVYGTAQKGLDARGGYMAMAGFLGCFNIIPPVHLLCFLMSSTNRQKLPPELIGDDKYIAIGAVATLVLVAIGICTTYQKAIEK